MHDGVRREGLSDGCGTERSAAQGDHARVRAGEQAEHHLLLARAKRLVALAIVELLDRLAELVLELVVGVERFRPELRRDAACRGRLAGTHEADEDERALAPA